MDEARKLRSKMVLYGYTVKSLAEELGISKQSMNYALAGKTRSVRIRKFLCEKLKFPYHDWGYFDEKLIYS